MGAPTETRREGLGLMMGLAEPEMRVTGRVCVGQAGTLVLCSFAARKLVPGQQNF